MSAFSQSSLQDYVECARRYELRYVQQLAWPAPEAEPLAEHERLTQQGAAFHRLVHQYLLGIPADSLAPLAEAEGVGAWWQSFLAWDFKGLVYETHYPEIILTVPLAGARLVARYDLITVQPGGHVTIVDWKTTLRRSSREKLAARLQTLVYPYVLAQAGAHLYGGQAIPPEQIEMVYWFASYPDQPEHFAYDAARFQADGERLAALIGEIQARTVFPLTEDNARCTFCVYRSLCRRGVKAGDVREMDSDGDDPDDLHFDFDHIAEIEF